MKTIQIDNFAAMMLLLKNQHQQSKSKLPFYQWLLKKNIIDKQELLRLEGSQDTIKVSQKITTYSALDNNAQVQKASFTNKYTLYHTDKGIKIQKLDYIEDGFYILIEGSDIFLYEIPLHGGEGKLIDVFKTLEEAIIAGENLT